MRVFTQAMVDAERKRSYAAGCQKVRDQWRAWYDALPVDVRNAIDEAEQARRQKEAFQRGVKQRQAAA